MPTLRSAVVAQLPTGGDTVINCRVGWATPPGGDTARAAVAFYATPRYRDLRRAAACSAYARGWPTLTLDFPAELHPTKPWAAGTCVKAGVAASAARHAARCFPSASVLLLIDADALVIAPPPADPASILLPRPPEHPWALAAFQPSPEDNRRWPLVGSRLCSGTLAVNLRNRHHARALDAWAAAVAKIADTSSVLEQDALADLAASRDPALAVAPLSPAWCWIPDLMPWAEPAPPAVVHTQASRRFRPEDKP